MKNVLKSVTVAMTMMVETGKVIRKAQRPQTVSKMTEKERTTTSIAKKRS